MSQKETVISFLEKIYRTPEFPIEDLNFASHTTLMQMILLEIVQVKHQIVAMHSGMKNQGKFARDWVDFCKKNMDKPPPGDEWKDQGDD